MLPDLHPALDEAAAARLCEVALAGIVREYPNKPLLVLGGDADAVPPRQSHPVFFGCFDWHSAVHSHWCALRLTRAFPGASWAVAARRSLADRLTPANLAAELATIRPALQAGFERPYGLAWLLQLDAELIELAAAGSSDAAATQTALEPLARLAAERINAWADALPYPIRSGQHGQSAFGLGLALDWARVAGDRATAELLADRAAAWHAGDRDPGFGREPSGHDFLSPGLAEADLMRRVLDPVGFARWLDQAWPAGCPLTPVDCPDREDGKLAHLDGLNLSRAWMLEGVARQLPHGDPRRPSLLAAAADHLAAGLPPALTAGTYMTSHWLGSFATYALTRRGCQEDEE